MAVDIFINFNGNCREAVDFYASAFGVEKQTIMAYGDVGPEQGFPVSAEYKDLVMYTFLPIYGSNIMFMDLPPGMECVIGNNINLTIGCQTAEEINILFNRLKEGGSVQMELQQTFFSKWYGAVIDKFGLPWQFLLNESTP